MRRFHRQRLEAHLLGDVLEARETILDTAIEVESHRHTAGLQQDDILHRLEAVVEQNFPGEQIGKSAKGADGDLFPLEVFESFDLRRHDQAMKQKLFRDVNCLALDVAGDYRVKSAGRVS